MQGAVVGDLDEAELDGAPHRARRQRPWREALGELLGAERDGVRVTEQSVEPRLDPDDGIEVATVLPLVDEVADAGERVPLLLEACDQAEPAEMRLVVPPGATVDARRWSRPLVR